MGSAAQTEVTLRHRVSNEDGAGIETAITAYPVLITTTNAGEYGFDPENDVPLDPAMPWAIMLTGYRIRYGPGSAVLSRNSLELDPNGDWRHDMRAERPTCDVLLSVAQEEFCFLTLGELYGTGYEAFVARHG